MRHPPWAQRVLWRTLQQPVCPRCVDVPSKGFLLLLLSKAVQCPGHPSARAPARPGTKTSLWINMLFFLYYTVTGNNQGQLNPTLGPASSTVAFSLSAQENPNYSAQKGKSHSRGSPAQVPVPQGSAQPEGWPGSPSQTRTARERQGTLLLREGLCCG